MPALASTQLQKDVVSREDKSWFDRGIHTALPLLHETTLRSKHPMPCSPRVAKEQRHSKRFLAGQQSSIWQ